MRAFPISLGPIRDSGSSQASVHDRVFVDVLRSEMHGQVSFQPPIVTPSGYYSQLRINLRQRAETIEKILVQLSMLTDLWAKHAKTWSRLQRPEELLAGL